MYSWMMVLDSVSQSIVCMSPVAASGWQAQRPASCASRKNFRKNFFPAIANTSCGAGVPDPQPSKTPHRDVLQREDKPELPQLADLYWAYVYDSCKSLPHLGLLSFSKLREKKYKAHFWLSSLTQGTPTSTLHFRLYCSRLPGSSFHQLQCFCLTKLKSIIICTAAISYRFGSSNSDDCLLDKPFNGSAQLPGSALTTMDQISSFLQLVLIRFRSREVVLASKPGKSSLLALKSSIEKA